MFPTKSNSKIAKSVVLAAVLTVPLVCLFLYTAPVTWAINVPPDFQLILSGSNIELYKKDYPSGNPDFVQILNLAQGASVELAHGRIENQGEGDGAFGGNSPYFQRQSLLDYWNDKVSNEEAFCVTNGQFFSTDENPTPLAFPLKVNGNIVSEGYGKDEYPGEKLMLEIWEDRADIVELTADVFLSSSAPNIIAGLHENADKDPNNDVGRTFVGLIDDDNDSSFEVLLIFNSITATQPGAASVLRDFGATKVIMLDGGRSTQLLCKSDPLIESGRTLPQTIFVIDGVRADTDPIKDAQQWLKEWWVETWDSILNWWNQHWDNIMQSIQGFFADLQQQVVEWLEQELQKAVDEFIRQLCGTVFFPGGLVLLGWIKRKSIGVK